MFRCPDCLLAVIIRRLTPHTLFLWPPLPFGRADGFSAVLLEGAVALLQDKIDGVKKALALPKAPSVRKKCEGGCGFWGDEKQDGYCSVCYKKQFMGIKTSSEVGKPKKCTKDGCDHFGCTFLPPPLLLSLFIIAANSSLSPRLFSLNEIAIWFCGLSPLSSLKS